MRIAIHDYAGHPFQFELSRELARRGHTVQHLFFADDPGPKGGTHRTADDPASLSIVPISLPIRYTKERFLRRSLGDKLYGRAVSSRIREFKPDVVISGNTPLDAQRSLQAETRRIGARFVFWVQDFYSIAIERLLSSRWMGAGNAIAGYYRRMETRLLERSDAIVLISPDFRRYLPSSLTKPENVHVIPNWGALNAISPRPKANGWSAQHQLSDKFVFMYTGTLALKHDPGLLLALSDAFEGDADVEIAVVASGVSAEALKAENQRNPRRNLRLLPLQPIEDMPDVLGTSDVLMAVLESDAAEFSVPSKLLSYLCAKKPILLSAPSSNLATRVLNESGAGLHAEAAHTESFLQAARQLRQDAALRQALGTSGRAYAETHFDIELVASRFEEVIGFTSPAGATSVSLPEMARHLPAASADLPVEPGIAASA